MFACRAAGATRELTVRVRVATEGGEVVVERIDVTLTELRQALGRAEREQVDARDWPLIRALLSKQIVRAENLQERMVAKIAAAAAAEAAATEDASGRPEVIDVEHSVVEETATPSATPTEANATSKESKSPASGSAPEKPDPEKPKGHGRNGVDAYGKAKQFFNVLAGVIGTVCAMCGVGKMYRYRAKTIIRIIGQPLFTAEAHHYEQARCRKCFHIVRATDTGTVCAHEGIGSDYVRYDWSACAMLMVMHYFSGLPFKRIESLHNGWGTPMADANQWAVVSAGHDLLLALFKALEQHAIRKAVNFRLDDTGARVISIQKEIDAEIAALIRIGESIKDVRTGINATGVYWETPDGPVILFYTGRHHGGEMVDQLLKHRSPSSPKLVKLTDAASKNFDHEQGDKVIEAVCNAHAFLKFDAIKDKYPAEYAEAGSVYKQVFDNDDKAKELKLTPIDRMLYHRDHSLPLMEKLKAWCEEKLKSKLVEPNSPLWEPLTFVVNQWPRLIQFCQVPSVPLDTNLLEQALIIAVRYQAVSFNYHTGDGATVGDRAMSLIATARANDVEAVAYLTECLRCHEDLAKRPEYYLPWIYRERMKMKAGESSPAAREAPSEPDGGELEAGRGGLRDLAPELREGAGRGVPAPEQDLQLAGEQRRTGSRPIAGGPRGEAPLRQSLGAEPEP